MFMITILLYVAAAVVVGLMGRHTRIGFFGFFLVSLLLTPILGVVLALISRPKAGKS